MLFRSDLTSERTAAGIRRLQAAGEAHDAWTKKFDREKMAKALLKGETPQAFAERHGVTRAAVYKAMTPELRRKLLALQKQKPKRRGRKLKR